MKQARFLSFVFLLFYLPSILNAQIKVHPEIKKITASPGEKIKGSIWVTGDGKVKIETEDWTHGRCKGAQWLKIKPEEFVVKHGKKKEVKWKVKVPKAAEGDLVAQIFVSSKDTEKFGAFNIGTRIASGLYITVRGTERRNAELLDFFMKQTDKNCGFGVIFKNTGNVHLCTRGKILLNNLKTGTTTHMELRPWFYRAGESFTLWSWLNRKLSEGKYRSKVMISYTAPSGLEQKIEKTIQFLINNNEKTLKN